MAYHERVKARGGSPNMKNYVDADAGKRLNLFHHGGEDQESIDSLERDLPDKQYTETGPKWGSMHNPYGKHHSVKVEKKKVRIQESPSRTHV